MEALSFPLANFIVIIDLYQAEKKALEPSTTRAVHCPPLAGAGWSTIIKMRMGVDKLDAASCQNAFVAEFNNTGSPMPGFLIGSNCVLASPTTIHIILFVSGYLLE